jgi:mono/diheme cytochrome c family protein
MRKIASGFAVMILALLAWSAQPHESHGAGSHHHPPSATMPEENADAPIRMTMEQLHEMGGVSMGWTFALPKGDPGKGRQVFVKLECYACHAVQGESFPRGPGQAGPDLTGMGAFHPAGYFAESIVNPNRIIVVGEGYTGSDGLSTMPNYNDTLTVAELIDLVAYLKSLQGPMPRKGMGHTGQR